MSNTGKNGESEVIDSEAEKLDDEQGELGGTGLPEVSNFNMVLITGFGLALLIIIVMLASQSSPTVVEAQTQSDTPIAVTPGSMPGAPAAQETGGVLGNDVIERQGEGRHFYTSIKIPPGAETLYLSGSGARAQADGSYGDMEQQTIDTFTRFKATLEEQGWSMSDIVQVRAFAVAGEYGLLDFDGFNRAYRQFFGTEENPMKPVRSFVQIEGLVVPGWLVEIEIRAARVPD